MAALFPAIYYRLHDRGPFSRRPRPGLVALLKHLSEDGPMTVGELSRLSRRAQSIVSEQVSRAEERGWVARAEDASDRRRRLLWVTDVGRQLLKKEVDVLSSDRLHQAIQQLTPHERDSLVGGMQALVRAAESLGGEIERSDR